jgi:hypothetical protein
MSSPIASPQGKWEYQGLTRVSEGQLLDSLNEAGREGWELVSAAHYRDVQGLMAWTAILKRPLGQQSGVAPRRETAAAPIATPPSPKAAPAGKPTERREEETEFELSMAGVASAKPAARPKSPRPAPAKPRMELSDDFDFELAGTIPGSPQPTKQAKKPKLAAEEEDFDFELGESFPASLQPVRPQPPQSKTEPEDDTDFDLG